MANPEIEKFLEQWFRYEEHFWATAAACHDQCRTLLEQNGIKHIASYRAKRAERLRDKLYQRDPRKNYTSEKEILRDIVDLAGVRIALYFPGDRPKATKLLTDQFNVVDHREFPDKEDDARKHRAYAYRFQGYSATHLHVFLKPRPEGKKEKDLTKEKVEIQIASVLMHAWSEVEHDLVYKPLSGEVSHSEYSLLDQVNGLVCAGELAFEQLQQTMQERVSAGERAFVTHYELASYIYSRPALSEEAKTDARMGRVDLLLTFLKRLGKHRPKDLAPYLEKIPAGAETLVGAIVTALVTEDAGESAARESLWKSLLSADASQKTFADPEGATAQFSMLQRSLRMRWRTFETLALQVAHASQGALRGNRGLGYVDQQVLEQGLQLGARQVQDLLAVQKVVIQGDAWRGGIEELRAGNETLEQAISHLTLRFPKFIGAQEDLQ